jgi:hypothetical protein
MKAIPKLELQSWGEREFYKSYSSWDKLSMEQRNKTLSYFCSLPQEVQGNVFNGFFFHFYFIRLSILLTCSNLLSDQLVEEAMLDSEQAAQANVVQNAQMTKDDIVRLIHLYKEPQAQKHWSNLRRVMTRAELDSRKASAVYNEVASPLTYLAEIFNDYESFRPQNLMVKYVSRGPNEHPVKKMPYQASETEWAYLSNFTHDLEPTNLSRQGIIRGQDWIKATWTAAMVSSCYLQT